MTAKRPRPSNPRSGTPIRHLRQNELDEIARTVIYLGSPKHRRGVFQGEAGSPGPRPTTVEQAKEREPEEPFTMLCPVSWTRLPDREKATALLRTSIRKGQIGHPIVEGIPKYVWARDPDDPQIVYQARLLDVAKRSYKAYPLIEPQVRNLGIEVT